MVGWKMAGRLFWFVFGGKGVVSWKIRGRSVFGKAFEDTMGLGLEAL